MAWVGAIIAVVVAIVGEILRPKQSPPNARAASIDELDIPTAEEGRQLYAISGKVRIDASNVTWYGDMSITPIKKKVKTGLFSSAKQTIGHQYRLGMTFAMCFARADLTIHKILHGGKEPNHTRTNEADGVIRFDYNDPYFYGGETAEGGIGGVIRVYPGSQTQGSNAYMTTQLGEEYPSYRGFFHAVAENFWWGNSKYIKPVAWEVSSYPNQLGVPSNHHIIGEDANPICMIYELLTEQIWALGYPAGDINATNFRSVAETIYNEGLGMSMIYTGSATGKQYIQEILRHIDGVMYTNPKTGLLEIKLARFDYDIETLPILTKDDFATGIKFHRPSWEETKNTIKVSYIDREQDYTPAVVSMQDLSNVIIRNEIAAEDIDFTGFTKYDPAAMAAARALKTFSYPFAVVEGDLLSRVGWDVLPADVFRVYWPERGLNYNVFRVSDISYPGINSNNVPVKLIEDIFSVSRIPYSQPPSSGWVDPAQPPQPLARQALFELPFEFTGVPGAVIATLGSRSQGIDTGYSIHSGPSASDGTKVFQDTTDDFTPSAITTADYLASTPGYDPTGFPVSNVIHGSEIPATVSDDELFAGDSIALISSAAGQELVGVKNFTGTQMSGIVRAVYGTQALTHPAGATVWYLSGGFSVENVTPYSAIVTRYAKLLTNNPIGVLPIASATNVSITTVNKAARPNAPRYFRLNGSSSPSTLTGAGTFTWEWRDRNVDGGRITQPGSGSTAIQPGGEFIVRVYQGAVLKRTIVDLTSTTWTYSIPMQTADGYGPTEVRVSYIGPDNVESLYATLSFTTVQSSFVVSLMNFNGEEGSTLLVDEMGNTWRRAGSPQLDVDQFKYGGASLLLPGASSIHSNAAYYAFGTQDYTVEMWVRLPATTGINCNLFYWGATGDPNTPYAGLYVNAAGNLVFWLGSDRIVSSGSIVSTNFVHVAVTRASGTTRLFVNGTLQGTTYSDSSNHSGQFIKMGRFADTNYIPTCNVDDLRINRGVALYTASFTPPTSQLTL